MIIKKEGMKKHLEVMDLFIAWTVIMDSKKILII